MANGKATFSNPFPVSQDICSYSHTITFYRHNVLFLNGSGLEYSYNMSPVTLRNYQWTTLSIHKRLST